jgi:hypothetical protein
MKITIAIVTRARPAALIGAVMALWRLRSGHHDIELALGFDSDDETRHDALSILRTDNLPIINLVGNRGLTRGHIINRIVGARRNADLVTIPADWQFCITPSWDDVLAQASSMHPERVLWWTHPDNLACITPVIPRKWLAAIDWKLSPAIFPFWWDDTWIEEIDQMIGGGLSLKVPASLAGIHGKTTRGRDFGFWAGVFSKTRGHRVEQARQIASALGLPEPSLEVLAGLGASYALRDSHQLANAGNFQRIYGDESPPDETYLRVKSAALRLIDQPAMAGAAA